jgi:hypothetical protein
LSRRKIVLQTSLQAIPEGGSCPPKLGQRLLPTVCSPCKVLIIEYLK